MGTDDSQNGTPRERLLRRREFLADLLFASGALAAGSFATAQKAAAAPIEEGWTLPRDLERRLNPPRPHIPPRPRPVPSPRPEPQIQGDVQLPQPPPVPGRVVLPKPRRCDGQVRTGDG